MKMCTKCGGSDFNPSGACRPCKAGRTANFKARDPEKFKAAQRKIYHEVIARAPDAVRTARRKKDDDARREKGIPKRESRFANAEEKRAFKRAYMADRQASGVQLILKRAWRNRNPDAAIINSNNYRARQRANGGTLSRDLRIKLFALQRGMCACCGKPLGPDYHLDHRMPVALGGPNTDENMQLLTKICNLQKKARDPVEFMQSRGFLI